MDERVWFGGTSQSPNRTPRDELERRLQARPSRPTSVVKNSVQSNGECGKEDCAAMHSCNHIIKFADYTTVVGLISKNDESAYREEVQRLTAWCKANNLSLNVEKTKEMVVDFRRTQSDHSPLNINGSNVEIVKSTEFLGVHLAEELAWSLNNSSITKKARLDRIRNEYIRGTAHVGRLGDKVRETRLRWFGHVQRRERPGRLAVINGTMNSAVYQKILKENVRPSVCDLKLKRTWVLQQDNDPKH
ncbi:hypothetical protein QTP86_011657 [Hemibagrus guttatus]|nr:hypothetical protein QTP86_011657 [Hemibagrus guttatus]